MVIRYRHLIFDFDGVLAETNDIRFDGFMMLFQDYPQGQLECLLDYIRKNGGLSRYSKIRYFFEKIREETITNQAIRGWAEKYSHLVKQAIIEAKPVKGSLEFIEKYNSDFDFIIVSGSDQEELHSVCRARRISHYFVEILGSPLEKKVNLANLLTRRQWDRQECLYVGDSLNDYEAAYNSNIDFVGRNSGLIEWGTMEDVRFIDNLSQLYDILLNST